CLLLFLSLLPPPPRSTLFPYTTLFRSLALEAALGEEADRLIHDQPLTVGGAHVAAPQPRMACALSLAARTAGALFLCACGFRRRSEEHTSELQSLRHLVCRLLLEKKKK